MQCIQPENTENNNDLISPGRKTNFLNSMWIQKTLRSYKHRWPQTTYLIFAPPLRSKTTNDH